LSPPANAAAQLLAAPCRVDAALLGRRFGFLAVGLATAKFLPLDGAGQRLAAGRAALRVATGRL
jgi:hypothetical protein